MVLEDAGNSTPKLFTSTSWNLWARELGFYSPGGIRFDPRETIHLLNRGECIPRRVFSRMDSEET